jgi:hypothetical protein
MAMNQLVFTGRADILASLAVLGQKSAVTDAIEGSEEQHEEWLTRVLALGKSLTEYQVLYSP